MGTGVRQSRWQHGNIEESVKGISPSIREPYATRYPMMSPSMILVFLLVIGGSLTACANKEKSMFSLQDEHYQQILERQKAGIAPEPKAPVDLTEEMDQDDFERLGDVHLGRGDLQAAKVQYEKTLELDPERIPARYKLAVIYLEGGRPQEAYDMFHQILDYDLNFAPAYEGMGRALMKMEK